MMAFTFTSKSIPDANLESVRFRFEKSILYKYMVYSFQYVDPSVKRYFRFYESCRMIVMFLVSGFVGFCVYYNIVKIDQANVDFKTNRDIVLIIRVLKNFSEEFYYFLGLYLFHRHPYKVKEEQEAMEELCPKETEQRELHEKLKRHDKDMLKFMIISISSFVLLRIFGAVVYCILDEGNTIRQPMYVLVPMYRLFSLPFLIYFVYVAGLQRLRIKMFVKTLQNKNLFNHKRDILNRYVNICDSVNKTSNDYHIYVVFLVGSLTLYVLRSTNVIAADIIMLRHIKDLPPIEVAYHVIATMWTICDIVLLVAVLKIINEVSLAQRNVLSTILKRKDEAHNTKVELVVFLKAYHRIEGTGFRVFGIPTGALKTLLFASFVSLSAFIEAILFNESWN